LKFSIFQNLKFVTLTRTKDFWWKKGSNFSDFEKINNKVARFLQEVPEVANFF
jgi:hypothetical protein